MNRIVHFEIHASDTARAAKFYSELFGWQIKQFMPPSEGGPTNPDNMYWLITTGPEGTPGINGGMLIRRGEAPLPGQAVNAYVCTVDVANLDELMKKAQELGAAVALAKMPIVGMGWLGYLIDTEGNIFGMMQMDPNAR